VGGGQGQQDSLRARTEVFASLSAPASSSALMHSEWPFRAARFSGVHLFCRRGALRGVSRGTRLMSGGGNGSRRLAFKGNLDIAKPEKPLQNIRSIQTGMVAARPINGGRIAAGEKWRGWQDAAPPAPQQLCPDTRTSKRQPLATHIPFEVRRRPSR
jgi:hypothetical protein